MSKRTLTKKTVIGIPLDKSVEKYIARNELRMRKGKNRAKDLRSTLLGSANHNHRSKSHSVMQGGSITYFINNFRVNLTTDITPRHLIDYNRLMWDECDSQSTRNNKLIALRNYLKWAMGGKNPQVNLEKDDIKYLETKEYIPPKPELPPAGCVEKLRNRFNDFGDDDFTRHRNFLLVVFSSLINGIRPGIETSALNVQDVNLEECEITVTRKNSQEKALRQQTIAFRRDIVPKIKEYLKLRDLVLKNYPKITDQNDAFFIRTNPNSTGRNAKGKNRTPSWRLLDKSFGLEYDTVLHNLGEKKHRPYLLRHASVTTQVENARLLGIDVEEVAMRNDHLAKTSLTRYNDILRYGVEFLTREPKELTEFLEDMCGSFLINFARRPSILPLFSCLP